MSLLPAAHQADKCRLYRAPCGGCTCAPNHATKGQTAASLIISSHPSTIGYLDRATLFPACLIPPAVSNINETEAFANPRTGQAWSSEQCSDEKRSEDFEHLSATKKARGRAIECGWSKDLIETTIHSLASSRRRHGRRSVGQDALFLNTDQAVQSSCLHIDENLRWTPSASRRMI